MSGVLGGDILYHFSTDFDTTGAEIFRKDIWAKVIGYDGNGKPVVNILEGAEHMNDGSDRGRKFAKIGNTHIPARQKGIYLDSVTANAPRVVLYDGVDRRSKFMDPSTFVVCEGTLGFYDDDFGWLTEDGLESGTPLTGWYGKNIFAKGNIVLSNQSSIAISGFYNDAGYTDDSAAYAAYVLASGKIVTYYQSSTPSTSAPEGSIWFKTDSANAIYRLEGGTWVAKVGPGSGFATYIDATGVYTGTVVAENIIGGSFAGKTFTGGTFIGGTFTGVTVDVSTIIGDLYSSNYGEPDGFYTYINDGSIDFVQILGTTATLGWNGTVVSVNKSFSITGNLSVSGSYGLTAADIPDLSATYAPLSHNQSASTITSGTLDIDIIPTGTTSGTVALGNHLHTGVYNPNLGIASLGSEFYLFGAQLELLNSSNWNTAYSWGNHTSAGYIVNPTNANGFLKNNGSGTKIWQALLDTEVEAALGFTPAAKSNTDTIVIISAVRANNYSGSLWRLEYKYRSFIINSIGQITIGAESTWTPDGSGSPWTGA